MKLRVKLVKSAKSFIRNCIDKRFIRKYRGYEIEKTHDARRKNIRASVSISDEDKKNMDGLYGLNYGEKITYDRHALYTAYTGHFDARYLPELLSIPEFEHFENPYSNYVSVHEDKNVLALIAKGLGVVSPKIIGSRMARIVGIRAIDL